MELTYVIEHHIAPPKGANTKGNIHWPFRQMGVNDSVLFALPSRKVISAVAYYKRFGLRFVCRSVPGGTRVWRVE